MKSVIKKILNEGDFDWVGDVRESNPFEGGDGTLYIIDKPITPSEANGIFNQLVEAGLATKEDNTTHHRPDVFSGYSNELNGAFIRLEHGSFLFGDFDSVEERDKYIYHADEVIYYSDIDNLNENFDWVQDVPETSIGDYRYFDIYVCYEASYDPMTGEDDCNDGSSYILKIPIDDVDDLWDFEVDYYGAPGDEGLGIIKYLLNIGDIDSHDIRYIEYVREMDSNEYCRTRSEDGVCGV